MRPVVHLALHLIVPGAVAWLWFRRRWWRAWLILVATMVVDVDHLFADPLYDPSRCSIGLHPLHQAPAIAVYVLLTIPRSTRLFGIGLMIHMMLDAIDCWLM